MGKNKNFICESKQLFQVPSFNTEQYSVYKSSKKKKSLYHKTRTYTIRNPTSQAITHFYYVQPKEIDLCYILLPRAKLSSTVNIVHTCPPVYTLLCFVISHVVFVCFMLSLFCEHASTDSSPCA